MSEERFQELLDRVHTVSDIGGSLSLLGWDHHTHMPQKGAAVRGERMATLGKMLHEMIVSDETGRLLDDTKTYAEQQGDDSFELALWKNVKRRYDKAVRVPVELMVAMVRAGNQGYIAWHTARAASDFSLFRDALATNIDLTKQLVDVHKAAMPGVENDYDILLDDYEPGMKSADVTAVFDQLKEKTLPLVERVAAHAGEQRDKLVNGSFPKASQDQLVRSIIASLGFNEDSWDLTTTLHPFASSMAIEDIRITTKFDESFLNASMFGTMHEFGHGLYERQISTEYERTPLANGCSMAWHESQSRMWENLVGRGRPFWDFALPLVQQNFPDALGSASADDMYRAVNAMGPSLIRIEADELTYNFHIILRYELENQLIGDGVTVADLPEAWNAKVHDYLGIDVPQASQGVLQDVHWGHGSFGYFPTYALGNVLGAMLWQRITAEVGGIEDDFSRGEFGRLRTWLREHVHQYGSKYLPIDLLDKVLGTRKLDAAPLITYLTDKVDSLYA